MSASARAHEGGAQPPLGMRQGLRACRAGLPCNANPPISCRDRRVVP